MSAELIRPEPEVTTHGTYAGYRQILSYVNDRSPQFQGFGAREYVDTVFEKDTRFTFLPGVSVEQVDALVPQLCRLETYSWLNSGFYTEKFPLEARRDAIRHYTEIASMEPDMEVKTGLHELANKNGVLVFDYPDSDPNYIDKIKARLDSLGIKYSEAEELGTQTYFAGKSHLRKGFDPERPIKNLSQSFKEMVDNGMVADISREDGAAYMSVIDDEQTQHLYSIYQAAFEALNHHPCRQGLEPDEFLRVMQEKPEIAKLVYSKEGEITTLCVLGDNLDEYDWINKEYYQMLFPDEYENKQILYFPALATDPEKRGEKFTEDIIELIARMAEYGNNEVVVAFDCCDINVGFLDVYLEEIINKTPEYTIKFEKVGVQHYGALRLSK